MRSETDNLGTVELPDDALYGINTYRAMQNFSLDSKPTSLVLIHAMAMVKKAAALVYARLHVREEGIYEAIVSACDQVIRGEVDSVFKLDALQGGAGTSTNMCVNEVIANLALLRLGKECGQYSIIHPLDDVNRGQSTNDVYPTALRIAAITQLRILSDACAKLQEALQEKENAFQDIDKLGRTELMDAVSITLGEEFGSYAQAIARDRWRLYKIEERLRQVNLGGTAVGLSDNASRKYRFGVIEEIRKLTSIGLAAAEYPMDVTQNNDVFVEASGLLKALAVNLSKIAGDLRLMNSGPYGGFGEIRLKAVQQGSTIMPGKVNPVIPEMVMQCSMRVLANDSAISQAASHGEFELNAFLPLIADSLLESLNLLIKATDLFRTKAIEPLEADKDACHRHLSDSYAFATSFTPKLGYETVSHIVRDHNPKEAYEILQKMNEKLQDATT
ncbi:MAG: aspartate ammonia-lyase [Spirochaetia bacterium]|nr:aspartate ammonia-lyase [Spirochaetia bacterium]